MQPLNFHRLVAAIKRILITGPESSGKSWMAQHLARHFRTEWVKEYARSYLSSLNRKYNQTDIVAICKGQTAAQEFTAQFSTNLLFCDTGPEVTKIWSEVKFANCPTEIESAFHAQVYDFTLLMYPDLKWENDPLREVPEEEERMKLFELYQNLLIDHERIFTVIKGKSEERMKMALRVLHQFNPHCFPNYS